MHNISALLCLWMLKTQVLAGRDETITLGGLALSSSSRWVITNQESVPTVVSASSPRDYGPLGEEPS
jgi:hypothetical protein